MDEEEERDPVTQEMLAETTQTRSPRHTAGAARGGDGPRGDADEAPDRLPAAAEGRPADDRARGTATSRGRALAEPVGHAVGRFVDPVRDHVVDPVRDHVVDPVMDHVVDPVRDHVVDPVVLHVVGPVAGHARAAVGAAGDAWAGRRAAIRRRLRKVAREPLADLYELYPEARDATPREIGLRFLPIEEIRGTAVGGAAQRGGDFLPLPPFRGNNWEGRWQRIQGANDRLQPLPPIDVVKFAGDYWVIDGHNRVAAALYAGAAGVDAMVTELVPLGGHVSETPSGLLAMRQQGDELRGFPTFLSGVQPASEPPFEAEPDAAIAPDVKPSEPESELPG